MDQESMDFFERLFDSLKAEMNLRFDQEREHTDAQYRQLNSRMSELTNSTVHLAKHVEGVMSDFSDAHMAMDRRVTTIFSDVEELKRRMAEVEKRLPPQAA